MIKLGLKNYCKSFRFFFVPLGALSLGVVLGLSVAIPWIIAAIKSCASQIAELLGTIEWDWIAGRDVLLEALQALDWSVPQQALDEVLTQEYITALIQKCVSAMFVNMPTIIEGLKAILSDAVTQIFAALLTAIGFTILGVFVGFFVTRIEIRRGMAKRKLGKMVIVRIVSAILNVTVLAAGTWLVLKVKEFALLSAFLSILLYGFITFVEAYFSQGWRIVPFKKVIRIRNILSLLLLTIIEIALAVGLIWGVIRLTNVVFGVFVGYSVIIITLICLSLNAEAYVKSLAASSAEGVSAEAIAKAYTELAPNVLRENKKAAAASLAKGGEAVLPSEGEAPFAEITATADDDLSDKSTGGDSSAEGQ